MDEICSGDLTVVGMTLTGTSAELKYLGQCHVPTKDSPTFLRP